MLFPPIRRLDLATASVEVADPGIGL